MDLFFFPHNIGQNGSFGLKSYPTIVFFEPKFLFFRSVAPFVIFCLIFHVGIFFKLWILTDASVMRTVSRSVAGTYSWPQPPNFHRTKYRDSRQNSTNCASVVESRTRRSESSNLASESEDVLDGLIDSRVSKKRATWRTGLTQSRPLTELEDIVRELVAHIPALAVDGVMWHFGDATSASEWSPDTRLMLVIQIVSIQSAARPSRALPSKLLRNER